MQQSPGNQVSFYYIISDWDCFCYIVALQKNVVVSLPGQKANLGKVPVM